MIFPFLHGILKFKLIPVTWCLFFINSIVFVVTFHSMNVSQKELSMGINDDYFVSAQGRFYAQFILDNSQSYSEILNQLAKEAVLGDEDKVSMLGGLALRNSKFLNEATDYKFKGDQVAYSIWLEKIRALRSAQGRHPSYILGINSDNSGIGTWLSYQFVHSGLLHFLGNMIFLLIFGSMLEPLIGGAAILIVYLGSGMVAAGSFLVLTGASSAPLVGASGAVSGIMALLCVLFWRQPVRYVYWLFIPQKEYLGFVYLPAWIILFLWAISDLAGYLGTLRDFGGVAYAAHLGGEMTGVILGISVILVRKSLVKAGWAEPRKFANISDHINEERFKAS